MKKFYFLISLILFQFVAKEVSAQQVLFNVKNIDALSPCQGNYSYEQDFQFYPVGAVSGHPDSAVVAYDLFNGLVYDSSSVAIVSNTGGGDPVTITELDISNLNEPVFLIKTTTGNPLVFGQTITITFERSGDCGVANLGATSTQDDVTVTFQGVDFNEVNGFDINDPSIVLREPAVFTPDGVVRLNVDTVCMPMEILNAGLGDLRNMVLTITNDESTTNHSLRIGDTVLSFATTPTVNVVLDFMELASHDTSAAGILADSNLVNGEILTVYHCFTVQSCSPTVWDRTFTTYYGCNGSQCLTTVPFSASRPASTIQDERTYTTATFEDAPTYNICDDGSEEATLKLKYYFADSLADGTLNPFDSVAIRPRYRFFNDNAFYLDTTKFRTYYASAPGVTVHTYQDLFPVFNRTNFTVAPCGVPNAVNFTDNDFYFNFRQAYARKGDSLIVEFTWIRCQDQGQAQCTRADYNNVSRGDILGYIDTECGSLSLEGRRINFLPRLYTTVTTPVSGSASSSSLGDGDSTTFCYDWSVQNLTSNLGTTVGIVEIVFPAGIVPDTAGLSYMRGAASGEHDSVWLSPTGDTLRIYDSSLINSGAAQNYQLCVKTSLSCGALPTGFVNNSFSYSTVYSVNGCTNPPKVLNHICAQPLSFFITCSPICPKGLIIDEQRIERKNFGYVDPDNDNWFDNTDIATSDSSGVREDRVMAGDTLCAYMSLGIKTDGDDISTIMIEQRFDNGEYYDFAGATITVFDSSAGTSFTSTLINAHTITISTDTIGTSQDGNWELFRFTIDVDPMSPGFLFEDGDSIQLDLCWKMKPVSDHFFATGGTLFNTYIDATTEDYTLDNISTASYVIAKAPAIDTAICSPGLAFSTVTEVSSGLGVYPYGNDEFNTNPVPTTTFSHPCQGNITMSLYTYVGNNTQDISAFPNEIRPVAKLDTVYFNPDSIVRFGIHNPLGTVDSVSYWVERLTVHNTPNTTRNRVAGIEEDAMRVNLPILGPAANGLNYVVVDNSLYKDAGGPISVPFENNVHRFKFHVSQKEECNFGNANISDFRYPIFANIGWEGLNIDSSDNYNSTERDASLGGANYSRVFMRSYLPQLIDVTTQNVVMNTKSKSITTRFDIRYPAPHPFIFIEYDTNDAEINFVISNSTGGDTLYPIEYANGAFLEVDTFMSGDRSYSINYSLTACSNTILNFMGGTSCEGISDPNTIDAASVCTRNLSRRLTLIPTPSIIQAQIYDQPQDTIKLCEKDTIAIRLNSAGNSDIIDPYLLIPIQVGVEFDEIRVLYLDSIESVVWDTVGTPGADSIRIFLGVHSLIHDSLPGTIRESDTLPRQVQIIFAYGTNCDVTSGGTFKIQIVGEDVCGDPSIGSGAIEESTPINIVTGANYNFIILPSPVPSALDGCADTLDYRLQFAMLPDKDPFAITNGKDTFSLILPEILNYISGTYLATSPDFDSSLLIFSQYVDTNGNDSLVVSIPAGINLGEGFTLNFQLISNKNGECNAAETIFSKVSGSSNSASPTCFAPSGSFFCTNALDIQRGISSQTITIEKTVISDLMVNSFVRDTILTIGDEVAFEGSFKINNQNLIANDTLTVDLYCLDNSGVRIGNPITSYSFSGIIAIDSIVSFSDTALTLSCPGVYSIVAVISTRANDGTLQCVCDSVSATITYSLIAPPVAIIDPDTTSEDVPFTISVLTNDSLPDSTFATVTVTVPNPPTNGTVTVDSNGIISYSPDSNFVGVDTITYIVCDSSILTPICDTTQVLVTVLPVTDTIPLTLPEDSIITICLDSFTNLQNGISSVSICGAGTNGTATPSGADCFTYVPNSNFYGTDTLCLIACNGTFCDTTYFNLTITPVNDPPVAVNDDTTTLEDIPVVINVIGNDTDIEGPLDSTMVISVTSPTNGTISIDPSTGAITYTPATNYVGSDMFTYSVCDTGLPILCDTATVTITITPVIDTTPITVVQDSMLTFCVDSLINIQGGLPYFVSNCGSPSNGTATTTFSTCIIYTPTPGYVGTDTMCVFTCNLSGICDTTIFIITVTPLQPQTDTIITLDSNVCIDTTEMPAGHHTITGCDGMSPTTTSGGGTVTIDSLTGCVFISPGFTFSNSDTSCIIICDTTLGICDTTIIITVKPPTPDTIVQFTNGNPTDTCITTEELLGTNLTYLSCEAASNGVLANTDTCYNYIPIVNAMDTACIIICDEYGICDTTVLIYVPPVTPDTVITMDTVVCVDTTEMPNGHHTITGCDGMSPTTTSGGGTATIDPITGCVTTSPDFGTGITDTTCIIVCDTVIGICDTTIIVTVKAPTPDTIVQMTNGGPVDSCLTQPELAGTMFTYTNCGNPINGTLTNSNDTCFNYTPINDVLDTACVIICDENGICDTTIFIYVPPVTPDTVITTDTIVCVDTNDLLGASVDSITTCDGSGMSTGGGTVTIDPLTGCVTTSPDFGTGITDTTCIVVCKNVAGVVICDTTIIVTVKAPTPDTIVQLTNGGPVDSCLTQNELLGTMFTYTNCGNPINGTLTNSNDTCFNYTPINDVLDTACIIICDEYGICDTTIFIYVPPVTPDTIYTLDTLVCVDTTEMPNGHHTVTGCDGMSPTTTSGGGTVTLDSQGCATISPIFTGKTDTTCIIICDTVFGICDTTLIINMRRAVPDTIIECIPRDGQANDSNMNTNDLLGDVATISVFKLASHGQFTLTNDTNSSYQTSPSPRLDTVQVSFCDAYGFCDTFTFIYIPPMTVDTIYSQGGLVCVDTTEMPRMAHTTLGTCDGTNLTSNGGTVVPMSNGCVTITPDFSVNKVDTTCIVLCDTILPMCECDTTYIISFEGAGIDTITIQLPRGTNTADTCLSTRELFGSTYTYRRLGGPTPHGPVTTHNDTCINYVQTSTTKYLDTARVLICDEYGNCDTTIIIYVPTPDPDTLYVGPVIPVTNVDTCVVLESSYMTGHHVGTCDSTGTSIGGVPVTITGLCVRYPVPSPVYTGDTVCIIVCDTIRNITICDTTLIVYLPDTTPPTVICKNDTVYLDNLGTVTIDTSNVLSSVTDNTLVNAVWLTPSTFNCANVGPNNVSVYARDTNRNMDSCQSIVTVLDTIPPTVICRNITIQLDSNGNASIVAMDIDGGSTDNCAIASMVINQTSFDCSHVGSNSVTLTVTDIYGNSSSCTSTVTVEDNIAPIAYCPGDKQRVIRNTNCSYIVEDFTSETSTWDNCSAGSGVTITQLPLAGTEVFLENTSQLITITATDGSGNTSSCSFNVYARCVKELNIPQFISPDGSGQNDTWEIPELANYPNNTVKVFNRWGNLVMEEKGYSTGWNGSSNVDRGANRLLDNKMLPEGTYFYIIDLGTNDIEPYVGYLQIKR